MSCSCGKACRCKELERELDATRDRLQEALALKAEVEAHLLVLVALYDKRREAERDFGRQLVEARGVLADRKADV